MRFLRALILCLIATIPLATLFHHNDLGRWEIQHSAMAGPDEFSYLLMAQHLLHGGGLSLQADIGRDTFYPPGYPLLLAAWAKVFFGGNLTAAAAHALNTVLLSAASIVVYFLSRKMLRLLAQHERQRFALSPAAADVLSLLIAGVFATNWHVLETSLLIMSEPAFMLTTFAWLTLALRWPEWHTHFFKTLALVLLAVAAWSIRGAGIVCVAANLAYPAIMWLWHATGPRKARNISFARRAVPLLLALVVPLAYQAVLTHFSPEKSVTSGEESANSYPRQLLHGLTEAGHGRQLHFTSPGDYPSLAANVSRLVLGHFNDYASSFVPWPRENPDMHFRNVIGKIFGFFGMAGWLFHALRVRTRGPQNQNDAAASADPLKFLALYIFLYAGLYLVWPFDFARFWSPILPVMLVYAADAVIHFMQPVQRMPRAAAPAVMLALLWALSGVEIARQLGNYARRLNYVSDSLADGVRKIIRLSPDPARTIVAVMGDDDLFMLAWHFSQSAGGAGYRIRAPEPHLPQKAGKAERADDMLLRSAEEMEHSPRRRLFFFSYFPESSSDTRDTLRSVEAGGKGRLEAVRIFQKEIVASVWEIRSAASGASESRAASTPR